MKAAALSSGSGSRHCSEGGAVPVRSETCHLREHLTVAVALYVLHWKVEVQQVLRLFRAARAGKHIAPDHHAVYICLTNVLEYGLKARKVSREYRR